jgi:hypothetical protein
MKTAREAVDSETRDRIVASGRPATEILRTERNCFVCVCMVIYTHTTRNTTVKTKNSEICKSMEQSEKLQEIPYRLPNLTFR